ncbi:MAG: arginine--tRNA ligase [Patescibacteria group bacterium]|nr:arginine--tRNA ligase [Patescibacteria group bacterium]
MKELVKKIIIDATKKAGYAVPLDFSIETPPTSEMGDYATNLAMLIAKRDKNKPACRQAGPREIAEKIVTYLSKKKEIAKVEIAGPGFINIFLSSQVYKEEYKKILTEKENFGRGNKKKTKVLIEYISANPTGPLHVGNARGGPIGEVIANLLDFVGYKVAREFYVNDMGLQIERFGRSLYYWYAKKSDERIEFPADGYPAPYVQEMSELIQKEKKEELKKINDETDLIEFFIKEGLYHTIKTIREDCELIGIKFDNWEYESDLQHSGKTDHAIKRLKDGGYTLSKEGALWFRNPGNSDLQDKESVLIKSDGKSLTYFADDIAYHIDKFDRGYDKFINIWGANHHGHLPRFNAAMKALGHTEEDYKILFYQYIRLKRKGKAFSMGKRLGNFVTLRQVIEGGVDPDAFKYFILSQNPNTPFDFNLELAADTSEKNPVFYIKYAHARISSILAKAGEGKAKIEDQDFNLLKNNKEIALYKELIKFPELLNEVSNNFQIQSLPHYANKIAGLFHDFYANCQVLSEDKKLTSTRLSLVLATKYVLANTLQICGIEAPEKM